MSKIGFIGLGIMGTPDGAATCSRAGTSCSCYDIAHACRRS